MFEGYIVEKTNKDLLIKAIMKFGMEKQRIRAAEKAAELNQALLKDVLGEPSNVEEAIAEVEIMLGQMRVVYNQCTINGFIDGKLERLKRRVNKI